MMNSPDLPTSAPITITNFFKQITASNKFKRKREAATTIQTAWKTINAKSKYIQFQQAAVKIQQLAKFMASRRPERIKNFYATTKILSKKLKSLTPPQVSCPITTESIVSPMMCLVDGHTYESDAIIQWVSQNKTSPLTRENVELSDLVLAANLLPFAQKMRKELKVAKMEVEEGEQTLAATEAVKNSRDKMMKDVELRAKEVERERDELLMQLASANVRVKQAEWHKNESNDPYAVGCGGGGTGVVSSSGVSGGGKGEVGSRSEIEELTWQDQDAKVERGGGMGGGMGGDDWEGCD